MANEIEKKKLRVMATGVIEFSKSIAKENASVNKGKGAIKSNGVKGVISKWPIVEGSPCNFYYINLIKA